MLTYNTRLDKLKLPEYGRNIQQMVKHCLEITDRDERTACAHAIVKAMSAIAPPPDKSEESKRKLWDHLAIISDFALDIDWPYSPPTPDELDAKPDPIPLPYTEIRFRQYGNALKRMVDEVLLMPESPERESAIILIANQMKKQLLAINPDSEVDARVFNDLRTLSHGAINLSVNDVKLLDYFVMPAPSSKKKKKKK